MKDRIIKWASKNAISLLCVIITAVVTIVDLVVLNFDQRYMFAFALLAFFVMIVKIGLHIFGKVKKGTLLCLGCGAVNIIITNQLFLYEKLIEIIPQLRGTNQWVLLMTFVGGAIAIILLIRLVTWLVNKASGGQNEAVRHKTVSSMYYSESAKINSTSAVFSEGQPQSPDYRPIHDNGQNSENKEEKRLRNTDILMAISLSVVAIAVFTISLYYLIKFPYESAEATITTGLPNMFGVFVKYTFFVFVILLLIMAVIIVITELAKFIMTRVYAIRKSTEESEDPSKIPTKVLSVSIVIVIFGLMYFNADFKITDLINFTAAGDYWALPLELIVILVVFLFLTTCVNWFLKAIFDPHSDNHDHSSSIFRKMMGDIKSIIIEIIELVLNTAKTVIKFAGFIPNFFDTMYDFVFDEDCSNTLSPDEEESEAETDPNEPEGISTTSTNDPDDMENSESIAEASSGSNPKGGEDNES